MTEENGPGTVINTQLLTQLVLVRLDNTNTEAAFPVENIRKLSKEEDAKLKEQQHKPAVASSQRGASGGQRADLKPRPVSSTPQKSAQKSEAGQEGKRRRRRRRRKRGGKADGTGGPPVSDGGPSAP